MKIIVYVTINVVNRSIFGKNRDNLSNFLNK